VPITRDFVVDAERKADMTPTSRRVR